MGSIQLGDGNQLKVSITGGGAGDYDEEVVIKTLLPNRGTGLNIVANGTPPDDDSVSIRLIADENKSDSFGLYVPPNGEPNIFSYSPNAADLKPLNIRWFTDDSWSAPSIVFHPAKSTGEATVIDVQTHDSGKSNLSMGAIYDGEVFIDQSYDPGKGGSPGVIWLGGWFNRQTNSFTPLFRCWPPELITGNYTVVHLGNRNSFTYNEWLALFSRHEGSNVVHGIDVMWDSSKPGSERGIFFVGGWYNAANGSFDWGLVLTHDGTKTTTFVAGDGNLVVEGDTTLGDDSSDKVIINADTANIEITNPTIESSAGDPAGYLKIKIGTQDRLIPLYEPPP